MLIDFQNFEPSIIYSVEEFIELFNKWKKQSLEVNIVNDLIAIECPPGIYYSQKLNKHYLVFYPPSIWTYQLCSTFLRTILLQKNEQMFTMYVQSLKDSYFNFLNTYKTKIGHVKDIFQSGHSMILNYINDSKYNTLRSFIFADSKNNSTTITIPYKFLKTFFNIYLKTKIELLELPEHISVYVKRDPVIWPGSIQAITHLRICYDDTKDCIGISPFLFEALNMDVDGDTVVLYIVNNKKAKLQQKEQMLKPTVFANSGLRWSMSSNHIVAMFSAMIRNCNLNLELISEYGKNNAKKIPTCKEELPLFNLFQKIMNDNHSAIFGKYNGLFEVLRNENLYFKEILNKMMCLAQDPLDFQQLIIDILFNKIHIGLESPSCYFSVYYNILYYTGILNDYEILNDFVISYKKLPDFDNSFFLSVEQEKIDNFYKFIQQYIKTSKQLPLESNMLTILHNNSSFTYYKNNEIKTLNITILKNVGSVVPIDLFSITKY